MAPFPTISATPPCGNGAALWHHMSGIAVLNLPSLLHFLALVRGSAIGSTPAFGAGYPGSSPGPGAKPYVFASLCETIPIQSLPIETLSDGQSPLSEHTVKPRVVVSWNRQRKGPWFEFDTAALPSIPNWQAATVDGRDS